MKTLQIGVMLGLVGLIGAGAALAEEPMRVAITDFRNDTAMQADSRLGGMVDEDAFAQKAIVLLGKRLVRDPGVVLIDRRDFIRQIEQTRAMDEGRPSDARPSFLRAARMVNADLVLRGRLMNLSTGKQIIRQGGYETENATLSVRVALEALDATDGTVVAMADGRAERRVRQTAAVQTLFGESELLDLLDTAVTKAIPDFRDSLHQYVQNQRQRPRSTITVTTTADPALVEIDGVLVGSTPLEDFEVYEGDHVITVGRAGYRDVSKQILIEEDLSIEIPLMRVELTADEMKEILNKVRFNAYIGAEPAVIIDRVRESAPVQ